jgi:hypothetical protein
MRTGTAFQRQPSALLTGATASSSLPTPTVSDARNDAGPSQLNRNSLSLNAVAKLWPTPTASDAKNTANATAVRKPGSKHHAGTTLVDAVRLRSSDGPSPSPFASGKLAPRWVEWVMGFPDGWTDCAASATPSSRRSLST